MINAREAREIMNDANRYKHELESIELQITTAAQEGKGRVTLYANSEYCSRTIDELRSAGYRVCSLINDTKNVFSYCIIWSEEE